MRLSVVRPMQPPMSNQTSVVCTKTVFKSAVFCCDCPTLRSNYFLALHCCWHPKYYRAAAEGAESRLDKALTVVILHGTACGHVSMCESNRRRFLPPSRLSLRPGTRRRLRWSTCAVAAGSLRTWPCTTSTCRASSWARNLRYEWWSLGTSRSLSGLASPLGSIFSVYCVSFARDTQ